MTEEAAPREAVLGSGAGGPLTAPTPWVQFPGYVGYTGGVVVGGGGFKGPGTFNCAAIFVNDILVDPTQYVPFSGGTLTGPLTLASDPVSPLHAADKQYVDNQIAVVNSSASSHYVPFTGGTLTGPLTLAADPTAALQPATKQYVDNRTGSVITIADAPSTGITYGRNNAAWSNVIDAGTY